MKRAANLTVEQELLDHAKELGINLSSTLERALAVEVQKGLEKRWLEENSSALESYAEYIERHGAFSDGLRTF